MPLDLDLAPSVDLPRDEGSPRTPSPALDPSDRVVRDGFIAVYGDRWPDAYDRFVDAAARTGPHSAAAGLATPAAFLPGTEPSGVSEALSRALVGQADALAGPDGGQIHLADARVETRQPAAPPDATLAIQDAEVTVRSTIYLYGSGATQEVADQFERSIQSTWGRNPSGAPWRYTSPESGRTYTVGFDVDVRLYDPDDPSSAPGLFSGRLNPWNRDNFIEVDRANGRSHVRGGDEGEWRGNGRGGRTLADDDPAPHEFGHLLGLPDRYSDGGGAQRGWSGNIMAEPAGEGVVQQRDIDAIVAPHVRRFEDAGVRPGRTFRTSINP